MTDGAEPTRTGLALIPGLAKDVETRLAAVRMPLRQLAPSDLTFSNLRLFANAHRYEYLPGPWPCISGLTYDGTPILVPLFGLAAASLAELRALQGTDRWFYPIVESELRLLDPAMIDSRALRDDSDYLYRAAAFADYGAAGLGSKRQSVARLLATTPIVVSELGTPDLDDALAVLDGWCADKGHAPGAADAPACRTALREIGCDGALFGFLHRAGSEPIGFVLVEWLNPGVLVVRFAKGRSAFDGIFPYLFQDLVRRMGPDLDWLNFEQDLGLPNFRRTKRSFRPASLIVKHRLRVRDA